MNAIKNMKEAFDGNNIITKVMQGRNGRIRIDAKSRFYIPDMNNFYSEWCTKKYADKLAKERYGCKVREINCTQH